MSHLFVIVAKTNANVTAPTTTAAAQERDIYADHPDG